MLHSEIPKRGSKRGRTQKHASVRQEKRAQGLTFFGPETAGWGGGLPPEGVGVEKFAPSVESLSSLGFEERNLGCPGHFAGMSRTPGGVQKVCANKDRARFSFPQMSATEQKRKPAKERKTA